MNTAWFFAGGAALIAVFPKLIGRTRANDPIFSEAAEPATLQAIRAGAGGVSLLLILIFLNMKA